MDLSPAALADAPRLASPPPPRPDAARRTYVLASALTIAAGLAMTRLDLTITPAAGWALPFYAVAGIAIVSALMVFDVEFRSETYTFTFSEIVLVVGLFYATPIGLVLGRLSGELVYLTVKERQPLRKLAMNLAAFFAETVVLLTVRQALLRDLDVREPVSWLVALVAVIAAVMVGYAAVGTAVRWHGGPITFRSIIQIGLVTAPANTSLALVICVLLDAEPLAVPLLGGIAVFLLMTYRAYSSLRQRYESLSLLYDFTHLVSGAREPDEVLDAMLNQAKDLLRAERAEFWLLTGHGSYQRHVVDDEGHSTTRLPIPAGLETLVTGEFVADRVATLLARDDASVRTRAALDDLRARDALLAPILEGEVLIGFVAVTNRLSEIYTFEAADARMFATLASHAGVALQNGRLIKRLHEQARQREHEALHDPLTGLPNRVRFSEQLAARFAWEGAEVDTAIALMDLDGFKEINDTLGHQSGDRVLVEIADRLRTATDGDTLVVRLGGDEFALLAPPGRARGELESMCREIRRVIGAPMEIDGMQVTMGVSIGLAVAPHDGDDADTLIRRADVAMYSAKSGRGGGVCFYDPQHDDNTPRRLTLAHELRTAIDRGQLGAVFQPKVSLVTGRVTGVEALCRWRHPTLGEVMPVEFVPLADRAGVSAELTEFMLRTALAQTERWKVAGRDWTVSVNVSVKVLLESDLASVVRRLLAATSVPPERLILEITETHVMSDAERSMRVLEELSDLGVRLSVDDFGTGYSSLAYLQQLPVDEVKIDKGFIEVLSTDRGADAIVRSVIDLARNLNLWVVAEGVEDPSALARLRELGCQEAQGYFFAPPMSAAEIERYADVSSPALAAVRN